MIKLEKIFVLLFLLGLSVRMSAVGLDKRFQILPLPQQMEIQKGKGISAGELSFVIRNKNKTRYGMWKVNKLYFSYLVCNEA